MGFLVTIGSRRPAAWPALVFGAVLACGGPAEQGERPEHLQEKPLVVYSGRNQALVGPLLEMFEADSGVAVEVRYGSTTEMAATLLEEGEHTPAEVFLSQDAGALGALSRAELLRGVHAAVLSRVSPSFRSARGDWVGVSGRARVIVYNTERVEPEELPQSLEQVTESRYRGRFGVAPTNGSFQAHMAVYRASHGKEALDKLLAGMVLNEPRRYPKNSAIVEAVISGEVDWGLVNHYYLWRAKRERPDAPAANFFPPARSSGFVNVAGAGKLSDRPQAATLIDFLLSEKAQRYFAEETLEYPLLSGVEPSVDLPALAGIAVVDADFGEVSAVFEETLSMIAASGLVQ